MNAHQDGAKLRTLVANRILHHMLRRLDETDIEPELLCKLAHSFCEIRKQDIAAEKNATAIEVARVKTANKKTNRETDGYDEDAPYGRRPDGTPHTHAEFLETLDEALKDVYGFSLHDKPQPVPGLHIIPPKDPPTPPPWQRGSNEGSNPVKPSPRSTPSAPVGPAVRTTTTNGLLVGTKQRHPPAASPPVSNAKPKPPLPRREGPGEGRTPLHRRPNPPQARVPETESRKTQAPQ